MRIYLRLLLLLALTWSITSCQASSPTIAPSPQATQPAASTPAPSPTPGASQDALQLTVLYTNDEHGWMLGMDEGQGAAELTGLLKEKEGYGGQEATLLLSGGDNWVGPAISTWFKGQSMIEVMNAMGYAASAIGNHEFDFGLKVLKERTAQASFPYLSANIRYASSGEPPADLGIQPYVVLDVAGLKVGVVGLTTLSTLNTTNPANLTAFEFLDYEDALREVIPQARAAGAQLILVDSHVCTAELASLALKVSDLGIRMFGAGHCHELFSTRVGDTAIVSAGSNLTAYGYVRFTLDPATGEVLEMKVGTQRNSGGRADEAVAAVVSSWQAKAEAELGVEIGYLKKEIARRSEAMQSLFTETWLIGYPTADIALTNLGGMRDRFAAGPLTLGAIYSAMPFDNTLVDVRLTGTQVLDVLRAGAGNLAVGGLHWAAGKWVLDKTNQPLQADQTYSVLVNDFMYAGGDQFEMLARYDPEAYMTGIDWRQPVIDWIQAQNSSSANPLDQAVADLAD
ncbi:MAG: bifunctional metallophosphatase/5'-nucleotidase [Anaerolineales bacterium]|nr:bifunctional metallophosphatase/5'-nucleotidase [Anaerolineales bacterium]